MLHIDIFDDFKNKTERVGKYEDFFNLIVEQMPEMKFTSKWFSTKGVMDTTQLKREFFTALDRVIQNARDKEKRS